MGFFASLFGRKKSPDDSPSGQGADAGDSSSGSVPAKYAWSRRLRRATHAHDFDWDWDNVKARQLVHEVLADAAPRFGGAKIKELPDNENIDLRGTFDGAAIRFAVWMSFGTFWTMEMRCPNRLGRIDIERDHEKIPKHRDDDDPWEENEERRVFLAKGIFFEGSDDDVSKKLETWSKLPETLQARILADMERLDIRAIRSFSEDVSLNQRPALPELEDPIGYMEDCAGLMAAIKSAIAEGDRDPAAEPRVRFRGPVEINGVRIDPGAVPGSAGAHERFTCKFCSSVFLLAAASHKCPNCGAPSRG
jgi:hypothetical protein